MGSGKGIARRVQASSPSPSPSPSPVAHGVSSLDAYETPSPAARERVLFNANKWADFLRGSGLNGGSRNVKIYEYYIGRQKPAAPKWYWTVDDYNAMLTELFEDAVALGVIVLPSPYTVGSFQFTEINQLRFLFQARIVLKQNPEMTSKLKFDFSDNPEVGSCTVLDALFSLAVGAQDLVRRSRLKGGLSKGAL